MSPQLRNRALTGAGVMALLIMVFALFRPGGEAPPDPEQESLLELLRSAEAEAAWPGLDVAAAAAELGTPQAAASFLRSHVVLQDYAGRAAAPADVLHLRGANAQDQAALLDALVTAMGFETRIIETAWPGGAAPRLISQARPRPAHEALLTYLELDPDESLDRRIEEGRALVSDLREEVETAHGVLSEEVALAGPALAGPRPDRRLLVEYRAADGNWRRLDPVFEGGGSGGTPARFDALTPVTAKLTLVTAEGARRPLLDFELGGAEHARISFLPAAGAARFLEGPPDPDRVPLWRPVIQQGERTQAGAAFTPSGRPAPAPHARLAGAAPPAVGSAEITDIDLTAWPEVALTVRTDAPVDTLWRAGHVELQVNAAPVLARVEALPEPPRNLALITDVSPSMVEGGRIFIAGEVGRELIARTARPQQISAATSAGVPAVQRRASIFFRPQDAIDDFEAGLIIRRGDDLTAPIAGVADPFYGPVDVVVLTDGAVASEQLERLAALRDGERRRIFAVTPALAAPRFSPVVDRVFTLPETEDGAADLARAIADASGSRLTVSHVAQPGAVGDVRSLTLGFAGSDIIAQAEYAVPAGPVGRARIELSLIRGGAPLGEARTLVELGGTETAMALLAEHALFVSGARFDSAAIMRAFYGRERFIFEAGLETGPARPPAGPDADMLAAAHQITRMTQAGSDLSLTGRRLQALLLTASPSVRGDDLVVSTRLDLVSDAGLGEAGGARAGFAAAAAEAALLRTSSVNDRLTGGPRVSVDPRTPLPPHWPEAALRRLRGEQNTLVASPDGLEGWLVDAEGHVSARLFLPAAKGASVDQVAAKFDRIRTALGLSGAVSSGLLSPHGVSGAKVGALFAILDFDVRLFCASSVMMGFVAEAIERGDPGDEDWQAYAERECEIDLDAPLYDLLDSVASSAVKGELGDRVTSFVRYGGGWVSTDQGEVVVNTTAGVTIDYLSSLPEAAQALEARRPAAPPGRAAALARQAAASE